MKRNNIYFTNLGIVKCKAFELTNEQFLEQMTNLINEKPELYHVNYDKENDIYLVFYRGEKYTVKFGRDGYCEKSDSLEILKKLIEITSSINGIKKENEEKQAYDKEQRDMVFANANEGILNTNEEKLAKLEIINKNFRKKNIPLLKSIWKCYKKIIFGDQDLLSQIYFIGGFGLAIIMAIIGCIMGVLPVALSGCGAWIILTLDSLIPYALTKDSEHGWLGLIVTILSLLTIPVNIIVNIVNKIVNIIKYKKDVKKIKRSITDVKKVVEFIPKTKVNIDEINKYLNNGGINALRMGPTDLEETINVVTNLKNKILQVKDKKTSKKLASELYEIIKYYTDSSVKIKNITPTILSDQIIDLDRRIDEVIRNEKEQEEVNNNYDDMMETINHQKSIGVR